MITRDDCATMTYRSAEQQVTITSDGLLRIQEVCTLLNIERHTLYKLIDAEVLPAIRLSERVTRIPAAAVQRILDQSDR